MINKVSNMIDRLIDIIWINRRVIVMLLFSILFIAILDNVVDEDIYNFDVAGYEFVTSDMSETMTFFAKIITRMASPVILGLIAFSLFFAIKDKKIRWSIIINAIVAALLNFLIKNIIQRPRPIGHRLIDENGYSFPSGHSMVSMAFYGYLIYIINKKVESKTIRIISTILLSVLIVLIGLSRIYLGVHYTSDVCGGFCVALSYLMLYTGILKWMDERK
ncbi:MAG: phosphatase PAP2 family protein [Clostridia bacterium]|nr:phosphatase PAP2 family protein [Clostridia bacterium]